VVPKLIRFERFTFQASGSAGGILTKYNMTKQPYVYILANGMNGTIYIGVTSNLIQRIWQHKNKQVAGFTKKYNVHSLVYYEQHEMMDSAITREKQLKKWNREWKISLIEKDNPLWEDLWVKIQ
jgi:putative endonuclease